MFASHIFGSHKIEKKASYLLLINHFGIKANVMSLMARSLHYPYQNICVVFYLTLFLQRMFNHASHLS